MNTIEEGAIVHEKRKRDGEGDLDVERGEGNDHDPRAAGEFVIAKEETAFH